MPQISVIVPVYKVEPYLYRCVDSILEQAFADFELILVDDGSPDNCGVICDEYAAKDARVHVIHQKNAGLSAARNAGIDWMFANSNSEWITFVDSDDWVHPQYLAALLEGVQQHGVQVSACGLYRTKGETRKIREWKSVRRSAEDVYTDGWQEIRAYACARLFARDLFREIRFPVGKAYEDIFVTHLALLPAQWIAWIDAPLYAYFDNSQSITKSAVSRRNLDYLEAYEKLIGYLYKHSFARAHRLAVMTYLRESCHYAEIALNQWNDAALSKKLRVSARKMFFSEWRRCGVTINNSPKCYETLFPLASQCYWVAAAQISKIRKLIG